MIPWTVSLSWLENADPHPLFRRAILTGKVGQADLVFGVQSGFISRPVHARLQVFVCRFVPRWLTSRLTQKQHSK